MKIYFTFYAGYFEAIETLIKYGADVNAVNGDDNNTALIVAAENGILQEKML